MEMNLDCDKAERFHLGKGWVVYDVNTGHIIAHDLADDCAFAWMKAAHKLAAAISKIERTCYGVGRTDGQ